MYLVISHVLKSQNQIFPRRGAFSPPNPTPPHPAGVLSDALRAAVRIWVGIWVGVGCWEIFVFETVKTFSILGIASIANENHDGASEKFVCFFVGFTHTHPARFCSASGFVSICVASWKIVVPLSANALVGPLSFAWCGQWCPVPCGALRWAVLGA